jgi:hypothetical protein
VDKIHGHFSPSSLASLLGVSALICQRALVDESGMIRTKKKAHNISENGRSAWDALHDTTQ